MNGIRHDYDDNSIPEPGEYGRLQDGTWYGVPPGTELIANLNNHEIVEHEDGTITVSPSILVSLAHKGEQWHGFLERGAWREV